MAATRTNLPSPTAAGLGISFANIGVGRPPAINRFPDPAMSVSRQPAAPAAPDPGRRVTPRPEATDRRRRGWGEFRAAYPGLVATMGIAFLFFVAIDLWMGYKWFHYRDETTRLRQNMSQVERQRADAAVASEANKLQVMVELIRRQAQVDQKLHLTVQSDSNAMYLEREGARLRVMPAELGPEKTVGDGADTVRMVAPRGNRTVERVLGAGDSWTVPRWVYLDRGLPVAPERALKGALGPSAILLNGGTVIYSMPSVGPLNDSAYVMPGAIRVRAADLKAVLPNIQAGTVVYFY